jgi:hypothetical protein
MADVPPDLDNASPEDLNELVQTLLERVNALERENAALRDEVALLKGKPPRPDVKPSGMAEKAQSRGALKAKPKAKKPGRGSKRSQLRIDEDRHLRPAGLPSGSRFKGYQDHVVQELVIRARTVRYRRERWLTPDGRTLMADLPGDVQGHYGGDLRRLIVALYHRGQMTIPRLTTQLRDLGVDIDRRQVRRLLDDTDAQDFLTESQDVLHAGLSTAAWISVDDTGARHQARNGYCTQIGDDRFKAFLTRFPRAGRTSWSCCAPGTRTTSSTPRRSPTCAGVTCRRR